MDHKVFVRLVMAKVVFCYSCLPGDGFNLTAQKAAGCNAGNWRIALARYQYLSANGSGHVLL